MAEVENLSQKIKNRRANIGVLGVGYVGWELCRSFAAAGFHVVGYEPNPDRADALQKQCQPGKTLVSTDIGWLEKRDIYILAVPTPVDEEQKPDLTCLRRACALLSTYARPGALVILESTVAPGTTRSLVRPAIGLDRLYGYSSERINPGDKEWNFCNTPKLVSGLTREALDLTDQLYSSVCMQTFRCTRPEIAEAAKCLENTYRLVNIQLMNQLKPAFDRHGLDIREVVSAASTKPFGFEPFLPGPGVGGHCIPVDPAYLEDWCESPAFERAGTRSTILREALLENDRTAGRYAELAVSTLGLKNGNGVRRDTVLIAGIGYKDNVADVRESPGLRIGTFLRKRGVTVSYHDPLFGEHVPDGDVLRLNKALLPEYLQRATVIVCCAHVDLPTIEKHANFIIDARGCCSRANEIWH